MKQKIEQFLNSVRIRLKEREYTKAFIKTSRNYVPVMVFQMGKVASSSIYHSIKDKYKGDVIHLHTFKDLEKNWKVRAFYNHSVRYKRPIKVISLTREPISRNISAFFQNFELITGKPFSDSLYSIAELKNIFLENKRMLHDEPLTWFDDNLLKLYHIDVYATPFPEVGWQILKKGNVEVLLMKSEIEDKLKESLIKDFLSCKEFVLSAHNVSGEKDYANAYKDFKKSIKLPASYLDYILNSKYAKHFYTPKELESSRQKWQ